MISFIKKYQKSSLAFMSIALLSASSLAQAEPDEYQSSKIDLCVQNSTLSDKEVFFNVGYSEESYEKIYQDHEASIRDALKEQTYVRVWTHLYSYGLQPRFLLSEAVIYDFSTGVFNYDRKEVPTNSDSFGVDSTLVVRSFGKDQSPSQFLGGASTISGPGLHYQKILVSYLGELPPIREGFRTGCRKIDDLTW